MYVPSLPVPHAVREPHAAMLLPDAKNVRDECLPEVQLRHHIVPAHEKGAGAIVCGGKNELKEEENADGPESADVMPKM